MTTIATLQRVDQRTVILVLGEWSAHFLALAYRITGAALARAYIAGEEDILDAYLPPSVLRGKSSVVVQILARGKYNEPDDGDLGRRCRMIARQILAVCEDLDVDCEELASLWRSS